MKNEYDLLKVIAIILVVIGHITILYTGRGAIDELPVIPLCVKITDIIYLFHMPLFIALSGAIFAYGIDHGKYQDFFPFLKNKVKRILIPFACIGIFVLMPTLTLTGLTENNPLECLLSILVGKEDVRHLWYLGAIFWCFITVWCLEKFKMPVLLSLCISLFVVLAYQNLIGSNILQLGNGIGALPSFIFGMWTMRARVRYKAISCSAAMVAIILLKIVIATCTNSLIVQLACISLPLPIIFILVELARISLCYFSGRKICKFILKNSFAIYLFHVECIYWFYSMVSIGGYAIPTVFILSISISILLAYTIRKLNIQFLIGE